MNPEEHQQLVLVRISRLSQYVSVGIGALSLLGWFTGALIITNYSHKYIPIAPSTALIFLILSGSLLAYLHHPGRTALGMIAAGAVVTLGICSLLIAGYLLDVRFEGEHLGLHPTPFPVGNIPEGYMSPITATTFIIAALSILCLVLSSTRAHRAYRNTTACLGMIVIVAGFVVVLGYIYGTPLLYGGYIIPMAFPTAAAFLFLGLGLVAASGPSVLPVAVFTGPSVRSRLMRYFLPTIIAISLTQDLISLIAVKTSGNPALLSAVSVIITIVVMCFVIERISKKVGGEIDRAIAERRNAEAEREKLITELQDALAKVKTLSGMLPICACCKKIRNDAGYWEDVASYISKYSEVLFSHGLCPDCMQTAYDEIKKIKDL